MVEQLPPRRVTTTTTTGRLRRTREVPLRRTPICRSCASPSGASSHGSNASTVLTPQGPKGVDVGVYLRFSGTRTEEGPFEITLPAEIGARSTIVANVEKQVRRRDDGSIGVLLERIRPSNPSCRSTGPTPRRGRPGRFRAWP